MQGLMSSYPLTLTHSFHRAERLFHDLWDNSDAADYAAAKKVLAGRYTCAEEGIADPSGDGPMIAAQPEGALSS